MADGNACGSAIRLAGLALAAGLAAWVMAATGQALAQAEAEATRRFALRLENGALAENPATIRVRRGDLVEIKWSSDRRTVLHLHGYDVEITVEPGGVQTMSFQARATGRFAVETHDRSSAGGRHAVLLYVEVHPR